jgi:hypothetical protein
MIQLAFTCIIGVLDPSTSRYITVVHAAKLVTVVALPEVLVSILQHWRTVTDPITATYWGLFFPSAITQPRLNSPHVLPRAIPPHPTSSHLESTQPTLPSLVSPHLTSPRNTSPHLVSPHLTSPRLVSPHLTSPRLALACLVLPHLSLLQLTSPHLASPRLTSPQPASPYLTSSSSSLSLATTFRPLLEPSTLACHHHQHPH